MQAKNRAGILVPLAILAAVYLITRFVLVSCAETRAFHGEIPYIGSVSQGIVEGWAVPFWDFQEIPYNGGYIINGVLAVPLFAALGSRMAALCIMAILVNLFGLILLFLLCNKYYGRCAAIFAALIYTFAPPLFTGYSVIYDGSFDWNPVFGIAMFFLFLNVVHSPRIRDLFFLGIVSGFSIWHSYSNIVIIAGYSVLWFLHDRLFFFRKRYLAYAAGLAAGFAPWFVFNVRNNFEGLDFLMCMKAGGSNAFVKFCGLVSDVWRRMFLFDEFAAFGGTWFNAVYYGLFLLSAAYLIRLGIRRKTGREWEVLIFPLVFAGMYAVSDREFLNSGWGIADYRYVMVILVFMLMAIAIAAARAWREKNIYVKAAAASAFVAVLFMGVAGNRGFIVSTDFKNRYLLLPGYYYQLAGEVAGRRHGFDLKAVQAGIDLVPAGPGRRDAYMGYGRTIVSKTGRGRLAEAFLAGESIDKGEYRDFFYWGCGEGAALNYSYDRKKGSLSGFFSGIDPLPREQRARDYFMAGILEIFLNSGGRLYIHVPLEDLLPVIDARYRGLAMFLSGCNSGSRLPWMKENDAKRKISADMFTHDRSYMMGIGSGLAAFYSGDLVKVERFARRIDIDLGSVMAGAGLHLFDPKQPEHDAGTLVKVLEEK